MRVAMLSHLASTAAPTGAERSLGLLARGLSERGHEVAVASPGPWILAEELEAGGVSVMSMPIRQCWMVQYGPQPIWLQVARGLRYALPDRGTRTYREWLTNLAPDVVHVNCLPHLRGASVARSLDLPVVWHLREILPPGPRRQWFARQLRTDATRIVAVSEAVAGWVREEGLGGRVEVVYNGAPDPPGDVDGRATREHLGLPSTAVVAGFFSQLVAHKGALDLVAAAHAAVLVNPDLHVVLAGHGPASFVARLRREIDAGAAAGSVHLVPPQPEIWDLLAAVDMVVLPTLWPDPLPRVVMEAMAAGRPVVAYDAGGVPEMVVDGETGLLNPPSDVAGLADSLGGLVADEALRRRLGEAGRRRAHELFGVGRHIGRMATVLEAAASVRR